MKYTYIGFDLFGTLFSLNEILEEENVLRKNLNSFEYEVYCTQWLDWHKNLYSKEVFLNNIKQTLNLDNNKLNLVKSRITIDKPILYPDVLPALSSLRKKGYILILLTNSPPSAKTMFEKEKKLSSLFKTSFWSFEIGFIKPQYEAFDYMMRSINSSSSELIYIGDSYNDDYLGSKQYGIDTLLLDRFGEYNSIKERINSLYELNMYI
jgi:FMN phosphatase YigB (HAD superfamily)